MKNKINFNSFNENSSGYSTEKLMSGTQEVSEFMSVNEKNRPQNDVIPTPDLLQKYNDIHPGLAARIIEMAEKEAEHRMILEKAELQENIRQNQAGQYIGSGFAFLALFVSFILGLDGRPELAGFIVLITISALLTVYIVGKAMNDKEGEGKGKR